MKIAVVHMTKVSDSVMIASCKIAKYLADKLQCPLVDRKELLEESYDIMLLVNGPSAFCQFLPELAETVRQTKRVIWVMNDYTIYPPTQVRRVLYEQERKMEMWGTLYELPATFQARVTYGNLPAKVTHYVNWNALTYDVSFVPPQERPNEGLIYWGSFRMGRFQDFRRYLDPTRYKVTVSAPAAAQEKFCGDIDYRIETVNPFIPLLPEIAKWPFTVYIEDGFSHTIFTSPANRFYEACSVGLAIFFDEATVFNLRRAGIEIRPEWIVTEAGDIRPNQASVIASEQHKLWGAADFTNRLDQEVEKAITW